jgi:hypothetical protein
MTKEDWQQAIYAALGIPAAVTDKAAMAGELLERRFSLSVGTSTDEARQRRRAAARAAILGDLAGCLEGGEMDRVLVDLEDIEKMASRVAVLIGDGDAAEDVRERKAILLYLLPGLLVLTRAQSIRPRLSLPAALRPYLQ